MQQRLPWLLTGPTGKTNQTKKLELVFQYQKTCYDLSRHKSYSIIVFPVNGRGSFLVLTRNGVLSENLSNIWRKKLSPRKWHKVCLMAIKWLIEKIENCSFYSKKLYITQHILKILPSLIFNIKSYQICKFLMKIFNGKFNH